MDWSQVEPNNPAMFIGYLTCNQSASVSSHKTPLFRLPCLQTRCCEFEIHIKYHAQVDQQQRHGRRQRGRLGVQRMQKQKLRLQILLQPMQAASPLVDTKTPADSKWLPRIGDWICTVASTGSVDLDGVVFVELEF
ncbi:hypothetical protein CK203_006054 [Vitis vinifera]|uniref:Uncharacterized protein n=1 Tax=Vitis vinifera TaxID=29760 RepID=A0A438K5M3_VITVI|nr:hypothetical protein CK203_006054 [Vitis vinifera]